MRPSLPRLLRIVPRSAVIGPEAASQPRAKIFEEIRKENRTTPTLLEVLQQRKAEAGANYPLNIRIEPPISKQTFAGLSSEIRASLEVALRERVDALMNDRARALPLAHPYSGRLSNVDHQHHLEPLPPIIYTSSLATLLRLAMSAKILRVVLPLMLFPCLSALAFHFIVGHLTTSGGGEQIAAQCPPNDGPYNIKFTNISAVDRQLCILVTFFHASFDSKNLPLLAEFASSGAVLVVLPYIEAARQGRPFLLAFPTLLGAIYQNAGAGVMFPLYWLAFILSGQTRIRSGPQVKIDQAHAEATLFALLIGVVVPSGLMYFMVDAVVTAAWQAFPVWMLLAQQAHLLVRPSSRHPQSGYKTIQATFIFTFLLSAITHITVIWPLLGDTATLKYSFLPRVEAPDPTTTTLQYATLVFLQWDAAFSFGASLLGTMWFAESLQQSLIILVWNVVGSLAFGPGAALSGLLIWREARLNGGETVSNVKRD